MDTETGRATHAPHLDTLSNPGVPDEVVLLDDDGRPVGTAPRTTTHHTDTPLHLAFSVHLMDADGRTLLTRRALGKRSWPGVWTGSCCGHPRPGESVARAVGRRVREELGVDVDEPSLVLPDFRYRAVDASGVVENELCPVYAARLPTGAVLRPDPREVAEHAWVDWSDLHDATRATPVVFSPWLVLQVAELGRDVPPTDTTPA